MSTDSKSIEGIYRNGKIELQETPTDVEEARVIVTFVPEGSIDLSGHGIDEIAAANATLTKEEYREFSWIRLS